MIIKSMSRKEPSFGQLMDYIDREVGAEAFQIRHNLMSRGRERTRAEFEANARLMRKRKNGVFLYHEIISITRARGLPAKDQQELLHGIVQQYIAARCPDNLVYGGMHQDKDHSYHFHLMISSNRAGEIKRLRLSKAQFREIQVGLEAHVLEKHPELEQQLAIGKRSERKRAKGDVEHERRTGRPPSRKEALQGRLRAAFEGAIDREAFEAALGEQGFRHAPRGKTFGRVIDEFTGKAHRLATLDAGLAEGIVALLQEPELEAGAEAKRETETEADKIRTEDTARGASSASAGEKEKEPNEPELKSRADARMDADIDAVERAVEEAERHRRSGKPRDEDNQAREKPDPERQEDPQASHAEDARASDQQERWREEMKARRREQERERDRGDDHER